MSPLTIAAIAAMLYAFRSQIGAALGMKKKDAPVVGAGKKHHKHKHHKGGKTPLTVKWS